MSKILGYIRSLFSKESYVYMPPIKEKILKMAKEWGSADGQACVWVTANERYELSCDMDFMMPWRCPEVPEGQEWLKTTYGNVRIRIINMTNMDKVIRAEPKNPSIDTEASFRDRLLVILKTGEWDDLSEVRLSVSIKTHGIIEDMCRYNLIDHTYKFSGRDFIISSRSDIKDHEIKQITK